MAEKRAKVTKIAKGEDWDGRDGRQYKFILEMENGDKGEYNSSKFQTIPDLRFKEGDEIDYEYVAHDQHPKIKVKYNTGYSGNGNSSNSGNSRSVDRPSVAIRMSTDLVVAGKIGESQILTSAEKILDWLNSKD